MLRVSEESDVRGPAVSAADPATACENPIAVFFAASSFPAGTGDWKSIFIRNLAEALARRRDVALRIWAPRGECSDAVAWATTPNDELFLDRLMHLGGIAHLLRQHPGRGVVMAVRMLRALRAGAARAQSHLYHINWLQNALALPQDGKPLLVSALGSDVRLLGRPLVRQLLRHSFRRRRVAICPNAQWMVPALEDAFGDIASVEAIPFGIDQRWLALEREPVRRPARWLAISRLTRDKIGDLFAWGAPHFSGNASRELHLFGPLQEALDIPPWVHYHGPAAPDELHDRWFPGASGLITLSRHSEGRPQVLLEAMAAGLPVIASGLRAHTDLLKDGETGLICRTAAELGRHLARLEDPPTNRLIGATARAVIRDTAGTWEDCAGRYHRKYLELLRWEGA